MKILQKFVSIVSILMFASAGIYFYSAYSEIGQLSDAGSQIQSMFFAASGVMFAPIGVWMLKNRLYSRAPYVVAMIISISLIALYVASRTTSLPVVGIQSDVGPVDIASKAIQSVIIVLSLLIMPYLKREQLSLAMRCESKF